MASYRLFATDMDGTLFGSDLRISPRTRAALARLPQRGCVLVLATGRMFSATLPFARELGVSTPLITYQGALIRDAGTGVDIWHRPLGKAIATEAIEALAESGLHLNFYHDDRLYVRALTAEALSYLALARVEPTVVEDVAPIVAAGLTKIVAIGPEPAIVHWQEVLKGRFGDRLVVTQSQPTFLEFVHPEVGKGAALAHLASNLGIPREQVVAVGDGLNDLDMIRWAGLGVAMGDANPGLRAAADRVTGSLADDGVAMLIDDLIAEGAI